MDENRILTQDSIDSFIECRNKSGCHPRTLRQEVLSANELYAFLPEDKELTQERVEAFRASLRERQLAPTTISAYSKAINHLLAYLGIESVKLGRGHPYDLGGKQFGDLTVISRADRQYRTNNVWLCRCICGKEIEVASTSLTMGNTTSCGCLNLRILRAANRYIDHTSLRQSLADDPKRSTRAASGHTGVAARGGKWRAVISYKGKTHYLGTYSNMEDAIKARARAKELVQEDAASLEMLYQETHAGEEIPHRPPKPEPMVSRTQQPLKEGNAVRADNTSGCTGVSRKRDKWTASITVKGKRYFLGCYEDMEKAVAVRKQAEHYLRCKDMEALKSLCSVRHS